MGLTVSLGVEPTRLLPTTVLNHLKEEGTFESSHSRSPLACRGDDAGSMRTSVETTARYGRRDG